MQLEFPKPKENKPFKIGIVGPEESKWKPEQIPEAKKIITNILMKHFIEYDNYGQFEPELLPVVVSGHCPVGEERPYCVTCDCWLGNKEEAIFHINAMGHNVIWIHNKGGVDSWVEIIATKLGIQKEIYPAVCTSTGLSFEACKDYDRREKLSSGHFWNFHFKPRNIQIAEVSDVMYCIVPKRKYHECDSIRNRDIYCIHCEVFGHPTNGGCFTTRHAKRKLGKEVHLIVIE